MGDEVVDADGVRVDGADLVQEALRLLLKSEGYQAETVKSPAAVIKAVEARDFAMALIDLNYARDTTSGQEGLDLLNRLQSLDSSLPVVVMTAWASVDIAVEAMRRGARDFVTKPWDNPRLLAIVKNQVELGSAVRAYRRLEQENQLLRGKEGPTLMLQPWPVANEARIDAAAEADIAWVKDFMLGVRQIRGEMKISMAKRIDVVLANASDEDQRRLAAFEPLIAKLAKLESVRVLAASEEAPLAATALVGDMQVLVPMAGLIDKDAELARLDKEITRLDGEVKRVGGKLANEGFVAKAPAEVLDKERAKLAEAEQALSNLIEQRAKIASL